MALFASSLRGAAPFALRSANGLRRSFSTTHNLRATWGFIGLGQMGFPMAKNLRAKLPPTDDVVVFDVNRDASKRLVQELVPSDSGSQSSQGGVHVAEDAREVAEKSQTILTVLPEPSHVSSVYETMLTTSPPLPPSPEPRLFIDTSTIDPGTSEAVATIVHAHPTPSQFVDAPMSGGVVGARAAGLTFMLGAPDASVPRVTAALSLLGRRVLHLGPPTSGIKAKLANNYLLAVNNIATAEAMRMGVAWGLDPAKLADLINASTGRCWPSEVNNPVPGVVEGAPAGRGYEGGFGVALMRKDLRLAVEAAVAAGVKARMGEGAREVYEEVVRGGDAGKDFSVVYRYLGGEETGREK